MQKKESSKSLDNALEILNSFTTSEELGISELARNLNLGKATVSRLISSFEKSKFLVRNPNGKYRLGMGLILLGSLASERNEFAKAKEQVMKEIASKYSATTHLGIKTGNDVTIINKVSDGPLIYMSSRVGGTIRIYSSALGKCILAYSGNEEIERYLKEAEFKKYTEQTITDPNKLKIELEKIKTNGFAVDDGETHQGLLCIAVPIFDISKNVIGAISISGQKENLVSLKDDIVKFMRSKV